LEADVTDGKAVLKIQRPNLQPADLA